MNKYLFTYLYLYLFIFLGGVVVESLTNASTLCAYPPTSLFYACFYGGVEAFSESFHILFFLGILKNNFLFLKHK
jgi:hypothetical protein